jgi:chromosome transmission fidelity protein 18
LSLLRTAVETTGEIERTVTDIFTAYPSRPFQDDTFLSKPNAAAEWLYFHDTMASRVYGGQEWELAAYLATPVLGFHTLFGSTNQFSAYHGSSHHNNHQYSSTDETDAPAPFSGPRADFEAAEALKATRAQLQSWHGTLSVELFRQFRSPEHLASDLVPYVARLLAPSVSPVLINSGARGEGGSSTASVRKESEKDMVRRAAGVMVASGVGFEKVRVEDSESRHGGMVWRMEP